MRTAKGRRRNPADLTLRNLQAQLKRNRTLTTRVKTLEDLVNELDVSVKSMETRLKYVERIVT